MFGFPVKILLLQADKGWQEHVVHSRQSQKPQRGQNHLLLQPLPEASQQGVRESGKI